MSIQWGVEEYGLKKEKKRSVMLGLDMATMYFKCSIENTTKTMHLCVCIYVYICVCAQEGVDDCYKRHIVVSNRLCLILFIVVFQLVVKLLSGSILPSMLFCNCMDLEAKDTWFISLK